MSEMKFFVKNAPDLPPDIASGSVVEDPQKATSAHSVKTVSVIAIILSAISGFMFLVTTFLAAAGGAWSNHKHYPLLGLIVFLIPLFVPAFMNSLHKKGKYQEVKVIARLYPVIFIIAILLANILFF